MTILSLWPASHGKLPSSVNTPAQPSENSTIKHRQGLTQDIFLRHHKAGKNVSQQRRLRLDVFNQATVEDVIGTREGRTLVKHPKTDMVFKPDLNRTKLIPKLKLEDGFQGRRYQNGQGRIFTWNVENDQEGPYTVLLRGKQVLPVAGTPVEVTATFDHLGEHGVTEDLEIVPLPKPQ